MSLLVCYQILLRYLNLGHSQLQLVNMLKNTVTILAVPENLIHNICFTDLFQANHKIYVLNILRAYQPLQIIEV